MKRSVVAHPIQATIAAVSLITLLVGCCTTQPPHVTQWEYKVAAMPGSGIGTTSPEERRAMLQKFLNDLGKDGWILVSESDGISFYLKRPLREKH